jgi:type IV secretion system protein VirB9
MKKLVVLSAMVLVGGGCTANYKPPTHSVPPSLVEAKSLPAGSEVLPQQSMTEAEQVKNINEDPDIHAAVLRFEQTKKAPVIKRDGGGFLTYPYGLREAKLYCRRLSVCEIELQEGEEVVSTPVVGAAASDHTQAEGGAGWIVDGFLSGPAGRRTQHITVKPQALATNTNLMIGTDRRVYRVQLIVSGRRDVRVSFWYPQDEARKKRWGKKHQHSKYQIVPTPLTIDLARFDLSYRVEGKAPFRPLLVETDGGRTFIRMPRPLQEMPAFFVRTNGEHAVVNYRAVGDFLVFDGMIAEARLVREREEVRIVRAGQ